jgi:hypothetical protein
MDIANILTSASIIIAAWAVILGVNAWRREYVGKRRLELAEEVLALFYEARDVISYIRSPFSISGEGSTREAAPNESPEEKQINDRAYIVFERYNKRQDLFNKIHSMRYRYMARFGKDSAKPFNELNKIVNEIFSSAQMLSFYWKEQGHRVWESKAEFEKHLKEMRKHESVFWEMSPDKDPILPRVNAMVSAIEAQALKVIGGNGVMGGGSVEEGKFIKWTKWITKYYIWAFGLMLTHLAVIREVITLPNTESQLQLLILLCVFDAAVIITIALGKKK